MPDNDELEKQEFDGEDKEAGQLGLPAIIEEPEQDIFLDDYAGGGTLAEAEEESPHQTNIQTGLGYLHPKFKDKRQNDVLRPIMVSRVFPDNHLDLNYFLSMYMIEEHEGEDNIDVLGIITGNQAGTSIGYEGRDRVEILEALGVEREEELQKLSQELGLAG